MAIVISNIDGWQPICQDIITKKYPSVVALEGNLGSGKTTFVQVFMSELFLDDIVITSPTFSLMNTYENEKYLIRHFDLYRITHHEDLWNLGFQDFVSDADFVFIEWASKGLDLIPRPITWIDITHNNDINQRKVNITVKH